MIALTVAEDRGASPDDASHTLEVLASWTIAAFHRYKKTPVIVMPSHVALQPAFFVALTETLVSKHADSIQFDWCPTWSSHWTIVETLSRWRCYTVHRALRQSGYASKVRFNRCVIFARPRHDTGTLVLGVTTDGAELPSWCEPLRVT